MPPLSISVKAAQVERQRNEGWGRPTELTDKIHIFSRRRQRTMKQIIEVVLYLLLIEETTKHRVDKYVAYDYNFQNWFYNSYFWKF